MDWINVIVAAICSIVGAFGGGSVLYFRQNKQLKNIEITHSIVTEWEKLLGEYKEQSKEQSDKIDKQSDKIDVLYKNIRTLETSTNALTKKIDELEPLRCTVFPCAFAKPPRNGNKELKEKEEEEQQ